MLHADDPELVALAEATLWQVWSRSGSPAVEPLFAEGLHAMEGQDWLGAVAAFSRVVEAVPTFAEGSNKRATARYLATHYATSIADCEEVVRLNPHHFGALSGQGLCHAALGSSARRRAASGARSRCIPASTRSGSTSRGRRPLARATGAPRVAPAEREARVTRPGRRPAVFDMDGVLVNNRGSIARRGAVCPARRASP